MSRAGARLVPFSHAVMLRPLVAYLDSRGIQTGKYLAQAGLSPGLLESDTAAIPTNLIFRFIHLVCSEEGIEDIGLLVGQSTSVHMLGRFGQRLLSADTIRDYFKLGCRLIGGSASGDRFWLIDEGSGLRFSQSVSGLDESDAIQNYLYTTLVTVNTIRLALGRPWSPDEVTIPGIPPKTAAKLSVILPGAGILAEGTFASLLIPDEVLDQPMPRVVPQPPKPVSTTPDPPMPVDFKTAIVQLVENLIITGRPDIHTAAEIVGLNPRTLQRRLAECGTHFSRLVAETRVAIAGRWIREGGRSFADIARSLGYTDQANFSRAFRRIKGVSPRAYRDGLRRSAGDGSAPAARIDAIPITY